MATIVMTGGTSGFGAVASQRLTAAQGTRLLLGSRRWPAENDDAVGETLELDLGSLTSVRRFADAVRARLGHDDLDALVLNAGGIRSDVSDRSADWYETTFAVNHLAPYLLARLLLPSLAERAVVVLTTSGTHDPATRSGLRPPRHVDVELLAHPERDPDVDPRPRKAAQHAYTASKLCTILAARALAEHPEVRERAVTVVAYCPGQVFGTGLARALPAPMRAVWSALGSPLGRPLRTVNPYLNSRTAAGTALAELATGAATPPRGHVYAALRRGRLTWPLPSDQARRDDLARSVWDGSARLVGLPG